MTKIERFASVFAMWSLVGIANCLPWRGMQVFGRLLGELAYLFSRKYRGITLSNLELAFGSRMSRAQLTAVARETYVNLGKSLYEIAGSYRFSRSEVRELVKLKGKENLELALRSGKGVIGFSAHFGNFGLLSARLVAEDYPFRAILRDPEVRQVAELFHFVLGRYGVKTIPSLPRRKATVEALKHLRQNKLLFVLGDQRELHGGVFVDFFGHPAGTATGPVVLAMRTGASIVPMFSLREPGDRHVVVIEPAFELVLSGDKERDIYVNTAGLTKVIERYVARYPSQWFWLHQRWKQ